VREREVGREGGGTTTASTSTTTTTTTTNRLHNASDGQLIRSVKDTNRKGRISRHGPDCDRLDTRSIYHVIKAGG